MNSKKESSVSTFEMRLFSQPTLLNVIKAPPSQNIYSVVCDYNILLTKLSDQLFSEEQRKQAHDDFLRLYDNHYANLQRLQELENDILESILDLSRIVNERKQYDLPKNSIWSNIKYHVLSKKDTTNLISCFIIVCLNLAVSATILGLATIPLFYTAAFFFPTIFLALGLVSFVSSMAAVFLDKKHASEKFTLLNQQYEKTEAEMFQKYQEQQSLDFTQKKERKGWNSNSEAPTQYGNRDVSCEFFSWEFESGITPGINLGIRQGK